MLKFLSKEVRWDTIIQVAVVLMFLVLLPIVFLRSVFQGAVLVPFVLCAIFHVFVVKRNPEKWKTLYDILYDASLLIFVSGMFYISEKGSWGRGIFFVGLCFLMGHLGYLGYKAILARIQRRSL